MSNTKTVMGQASNQYVAPTDITDVFSTYLYTGNNSAQTITNGIDLAGEGGLVWIKGRDAARSHQLLNTEVGLSGTGSRLKSDTTSVSSNDTATSVSSFNSDGFSIQYANDFNANNEDFASWTFRKAPKFFDVVTYTGTGSFQNISHNLGSVPGMIVVKKTNGIGDWLVYHRHAHIGQSYQPLPERKYLNLNDNGSVSHGSGLMWGDTPPTDTVFSVSTDTQSNNNGDTYVAYVFAHNDGDGGFGPDGDQDIIKCGSYTGNDGTQDINLGFEPQWILVKSSSNARDWKIIDNMRGFAAAPNNKWLTPNSSNSEENINASASTIEPTATGFRLTTGDAETNAAGWSYIYMAIRRGPLAQPESGTEVFAPNLASGYPRYPSGFATDFVIQTARDSGSNSAYSRLQGNNNLSPSTTAQESASAWDWAQMDGSGTNFTSTNYIGWSWKRAPGFCDVVAYTGNGTAGRTVSHNLGVAPEMMIVKCRNQTYGGFVYHAGIGEEKALILFNGIYNVNAATTYAAWNNTAPSSSFFTLGNFTNVNESNDNYIAYLFATLPGVSKVGSYTGSNSVAVEVDCGFTSGARFVLIKRTDAVGDWYVYDSTRGIVSSADDPYLLLNTTDAESPNTNNIEPLSSGFKLTIQGSNPISINGGSYIFYAIA